MLMKLITNSVNLKPPKEFKRPFETTFEKMSVIQKGKEEKHIVFVFYLVALVALTTDLMTQGSRAGRAKAGMNGEYRKRMSVVRW